MRKDPATHRARADIPPDPLAGHPTGEDVDRIFALSTAGAAELEAIIRSMPDAVYVGGAQGIRKANRAALDQLGYDSVDELNRHVATLAEEIQTRRAATGERLRPEDEPFSRAMRGETVVENVIIRHRKTGNDLTLRCAAAPVFVDGRIVGAVAINTDITERERLQRELESANAAMRRANDTLETFNYVVSHDLKEPVRAMGHFLQEAREHAIAPPTVENLERALVAHARLQRQLRGLLEFSRASVDPLVREPVHVGRVISSEMCRVYYGKTLDEVGAELVLEADDVHVLATPFLLSQALGNLILNALRHGGSREPTVRVRAFDVDDARARVCVEDNGRGFPAEIQARFERGGTGQPHTISDGFGLTIVKHAVDRLGGTFELGTSSLGGGSANITLPRAPHQAQ